MNANNLQFSNRILAHGLARELNLSEINAVSGGVQTIIHYGNQVCTDDCTANGACTQCHVN